MDPNAVWPILELVLYGRSGEPVDRRRWTPRDGVVQLHPDARQLRITVQPEPAATTPGAAPDREYVAVKPRHGGVKMHRSTCPAVAQAREDRRFPQPSYRGLDRAAIVRQRAALRRRHGLSDSPAALTADLHGCVT
jgi:hypothetical protein